MTGKFSTAADVFDTSRGWKWRAIRASLGTTTGMIVMAMLAKRPKVGPAFGENCDITKEGKVLARVRRPGMGWGAPEPIGTVEAVRDNMRRLCDHCRFTDAEREACFDELRKYVRRDYRATSGEPA